MLRYFATPWSQLRHFDTGLIAQKELFAALVAMFCFSGEVKGKMTILYIDNANAQA